MTRNASPDPIQAVALPREVIEVADEIFNLVLLHERNEVGNLQQVKDGSTGIFFNLGPLVVVDDNGNVVISGGS